MSEEDKIKQILFEGWRVRFASMKFDILTMDFVAMASGLQNSYNAMVNDPKYSAEQKIDMHIQLFIATNLAKMKESLDEEIKLQGLRYGIGFSSN